MDTKFFYSLAQFSIGFVDLCNHSGVKQIESLLSEGLVSFIFQDGAIDIFKNVRVYLAGHTFIE